jgi:hypothetical protein
VDRAALKSSMSLALAASAGAAAAGVADVKLRFKSPLLGQERLTPGVLVALGAIAVGVLKVGPPALYRHAGALGAGAAAYEAGRFVYEKVAVAEIRKVQGVGAAPPAQLGPRKVITARDIRAAIDTVNAAKVA